MSRHKDLKDFYRSHRLTSLALGAALLAAPIIAVAGDGEASTGEDSRAQHIWQRVSQRFDANQDGQLTADEVPEDRFARMDRNGDQVVTEADFEGLEGRRMGRRGHRGARMHMMMAAADANQDGQITADEWSTFVAGIDSDGDGLLSDTEITTHREAQKKALGIEHQGRHAEGHKSGHPRRGFADLDGDGQLETEDLVAAFSKLDRNEDGVLSEADRPRRGERKARGKRGERRRGHRIAGHLMRLADINGDQQLTQVEWTGYLATLDSNTDGSLSRDELEVTRPEDAPAPRQHAEGFEPAALDVSRLTEVFNRRDADGNGVIEGDEWQRRGRRGEGKRFRHGAPESQGESS